jgi:hypothetical protein
MTEYLTNYLVPALNFVRENATLIIIALLFLGVWYLETV